MSNNYGSFQKAVETIGINGIQAKTSEKNQKCVTRFIYNGIESMSVANYSKKDFIMLFERLQKAKELEQIKAILTGQSVASQKVNDAHGNDVLKQNLNYLQQQRTYATDTRTRLKGVTLEHAIKQYLGNISSNINAMGMLDRTYMPCVIESLTYWHKITKEQARAMLIEMIRKHEICVVSEHVYAHNEFYNLIKNWHGENDKPCNPEKIEKMTCMVMEKVHGTVSENYNKPLSQKEVNAKLQQFLNNGMDLLIKAYEDDEEFAEDLEKRYSEDWV